ncbi:MAG: SDR family NAD(P)-dependent oxidoreductase [Gammaproteobacteria bacterium]
MGMYEDFRLDGKVAVVTGGSKGIGKGIALALAECGADIVIGARRMQEVEAAAEEIRATGVRCLGVSLDVMNFDEIPALLDRVVNEFGSLDIMVNNAGGNLDRDMHPLPEITEQKWDEQIDLNIKTKWWGCQQAAKRMGEGGRIINISSVAAHSASPGFGAYSAANNGVIAMTRTFARELAPKKITVNCLCPGFVVTEMLLETMHVTQDQADDMAKGQNPLGLGYPSDLGAAAVFFASPAAHWTTGQTIDIDGGR